MPKNTSPVVVYCMCLPVCVRAYMCDMRVMVRSCVALPSKGGFGGARGRKVPENTSPTLYESVLVGVSVRVCVQGTGGRVGKGGKRNRR